MPKPSLDKFVAASKAVVELSMNISGQKVFANSAQNLQQWLSQAYENALSVSMLRGIDGATFRIKGSRLRLILKPGKSSIIPSMTKCVICAPSGMRNGKCRIPMSSLILGPTQEHLHSELQGDFSSNGNVSCIGYLETVHSQTPAGLWYLHWGCGLFILPQPY